MAFFRSAGILIFLSLVFMLTQPGAAADIMDEYLSLPGSYMFVRRTPEEATPDRVVMTVFEDFLCPVCYQTATEIIPPLQKRYGKRLEVRFVGYPLVHPESRLPARAYAIAQEMGMGEQMQHALFHSRFVEQLDTTSRDGLARVAHEVGLDPEVLFARLDTGGGNAQVEENLALGHSYHIDGVPGIVLDGWIRVNTLSAENLTTIIDGLLEKKKKEKLR
jgi:predicted DsbA family dithiol-disulfide isomerase